jgi:pSer/pThr/pTyr-binding forkhead associated (FHA) protein
MAKLVVLSEGLTGQSYELKVDKTTIGRVEDNTFQIAQPSVSSHHCEILLRGADIVVKDLNSTNGTFINNNRVTDEAVLKGGQILKLGDVEIRLETASPAAPGAKRPMDSSTMVINKGVSLEQLESGPQGFDTSKGSFTRKSNKGNLVWIIIGIVLLVVIGIGIVYAYSKLGGSGTNGR